MLLPESAGLSVCTFLSPEVEGVAGVLLSDVEGFDDAEGVVSFLAAIYSSRCDDFGRSAIIPIQKTPFSKVGKRGKIAKRQPTFL